jgi:hypothetical protein
MQIWTAPVAMLLSQYLQLRSTFAWSLSNLLALLRQQLFVHRNLWDWIGSRFQPPPLLDPVAEQLPFRTGLSWTADSEQSSRFFLARQIPGMR